MADAADSKSVVREDVGVQVSPPAPKIKGLTHKDRARSKGRVSHNPDFVPNLSPAASEKGAEQYPYPHRRFVSLSPPSFPSGEDAEV